MTFIRNCFKGIVLGLANVIPGVSAGTMAVILNLYDKIIKNLNFKGIKKNFSFFLSLGIGIIVGIITFSNVVTFLLSNYALHTNYFFIGVILGSIPMIYKKTKVNKIDILGLFIFLLFMSFILFINTFEGSSIPNEIENINISIFLTLIFSGLIAGFTMIIPGVSGSFLLLIFGIYDTITTAIKNFDFLVLIPFAIGTLIGILLGVNIIKTLLEKHHKKTYMAILGLITGSLFSIFTPIPLNTEGLLAILYMSIGCFISYTFSKK
ncbi:MAG: DUF368 domain-containing protein [Oscillospiraceae bacterium]